MNLYIYGLQRSGTNVIQKFIETNYNIYFMNDGERDRHSPRQKHFRIYDNKDIIPQDQYKNNYIINSLKDLDKLLGDMNETNQYIIVYKNIFSWLPSIEKWAKECNWNINSKMNFVDDYLNFIQKWISIKNNRVFFINYEDFLNISNDNNSLVNNLSLFLNKKYLNISTSFDKVNYSNKFTSDKKKYYTENEYMKLYSKHEIDKIINNVIYKELINYDL